MTKRAEIAGWSLGFVFIGVLAAVLGRISGQQQTSLDLWCEGESAHYLLSGAQPAWMTTRFRLDLHPAGLSAMRMSARLLDAESGAELATMHRQSAFTVQQEGQRLQVHVVHAVKGDTDSANLQLTNWLPLFIFKPDTNLSYWIRPLFAHHYLIDDGNDVFLLCSRR